MKIRLLLQREPFGEVLEQTLSYYLMQRHGQTYRVHWYEHGSDEAGAQGRRKEGCQVNPNKVRDSVKGCRRFLGAMAISVLALWLILRQVEFADFTKTLAHVNLLPMLGALAALILTMWSKAERWRWLLDSNGRVPRRSLILSLFIGYLGNTVLPARLGEAVRAYSVGQLADVDVPAALSSIIVEKFLDISTLLALLLGLGLFMPLPPWAARTSLLGGLIFLVLVAAMAAILLAGDWLLACISRTQQRVPARLKDGPWWQWSATFVGGFRTLRSRRTASMVLFWSPVVWVLGGVVNLFVLMAFDVQPLVPAALLTLVITNLGMALPSAPGYIGVHHFLSMLALSTFGVPNSVAFGYAVVVHALVFGTFALGGFLAIVVIGLDWRALQVRARTLT